MGPVLALPVVPGSAGDFLGCPNWAKKGGKSLALEKRWDTIKLITADSFGADVSLPTFPKPRMAQGALVEGTGPESPWAVCFQTYLLLVVPQRPSINILYDVYSVSGLEVYL